MKKQHQLLLSLAFITLFACNNNNTDTVKTNIKESVEVKTEELTIPINGLEHYIKKIGSGDPIVVLHGGPGLFSDFIAPHMNELGQDFQLIFYDQRGNGKTGFPTDTSTINIQSYVNDLEQLRINLKIEKLNIIGHSWGALLAVYYAKQYPENLNKLALVSPAPVNNIYFEEFFRNMQKKRSMDDTKELVKLMSSKEFEKRDEKVFVQSLKIGDKVNFANPSNIDKLYDKVTFNENTANNLLLVSGLMEKNFFEFTVLNNLKIITCPTLIMQGELDNVPFNSVQELNDSLPNSTIQMFKNCGQYPYIEAKEQFNTEIKSFFNPEEEV